MNRDKSRGFTLMEIMAVVILIGILATVLVRFGPKMLCKMKKNTAETQLRGLIQSIQAFHLERGQYPSELSQIQGETYEGKLTDPWNKPIQFRVIDETNNVFELRSGGCNTRLGDGDDVIVTNSTER